MAPQHSIALRRPRGQQLTGQAAGEAAAIPGRCLLRISDPPVMLTFAAVVREGLADVSELCQGWRGLCEGLPLSVPKSLVTASVAPRG